MIQKETRVQVADNSGARELQVIKVLGFRSPLQYRRYWTAAVEISPTGTVKGASKAVIVRTKHGVRRADGSIIVRWKCSSRH